MNQKAVQINTIITIFIVLFISISIFFAMFYKFEQDRLDEVKEQYFTKIENSFFNNEQRHLKEHYSEVLNTFIDDMTLKLMMQKDHKALYKHQKNNFTALQNDDEYFEVLHFHLPDGSSLLRMHNLNLTGDNIATKRPLVEFVHQNQQIVYGFDNGLQGFRYRIIQPLFYEKEYIGAIEIGASPKKLLDFVTFFNKIDGVIEFFIDDSVGVSHLSLTNEELLKHYLNNASFLKNTELKIDDKHFVIYSFDIVNFRGDLIGEFIFFDEMSYYYNKFYSAIWKMGFVSAISLIALFFLFRFLLHQHSRKLLKLHQRTKAVLNAQNDIVIVTTGKDLIEANSAFFEFTGFKSLDEFKKKYRCICDLFVKQNGYIEPIMDGVTWSEYLLQNSGKNNLAKIIKEGKEFIFQLNAKKLEDEVVISLNDITLIMQKDALIQKVKERLELTIAATLTGVWDWDVASNEVIWDKNAYEMLGYRENEFAVNIDKFLSLMHENDIKSTMEIIENSVKQNNTFVVAFRLQKKDGSWAWIEGRGKTVATDSDGKPIRMVGTHIDITKRKEQEMELERLNLHLQEEVAKQVDQIVSKDKLLQEQAKLAAMGEMIGAIAHQWRQPLNALSINIQNLDDDFEDGLIDAEFIEEFIQKQIKTIHFMSKTIDDFRNFFKADKRKTVFSIKEVIENVEHLVAAQLKSHDISIIFEGEDFELEGYRSEMQQVVLNLISNSKDAINKTAKSGTIWVVLDAVNKKIIIKDSGGGVDEKILSRIFEPYFTTKEQGKGTGIGLYMSRIIVVEHMSGDIHACNGENGLCVEIRFNS